MDDFRSSKENLLPTSDKDFPIPLRRRSNWIKKNGEGHTLLWIVGFVLLVTAIALQIRILATRQCASFWNESDFVAIKKQIPQRLEQVHFTAGLLYNESKQLYRPAHPELPSYVGEASKEIDDAWEDLIGAINVFVTPDEEPSLGGGLYFQPDSRLYMAQVTVFHDLHCLNMLRQNLPYYYDYYERGPPEVFRPHLDHCIDSLRLSLMCAGDMTLSPILWSEEKGRIIPDFEVDHTCRNYEDLKSWANERDSADPNRYPENAERLHALGN